MIGRIIAWPFMTIGCVFFFVGYIICADKRETLDEFLKESLSL